MGHRSQRLLNRQNDAIATKAVNSVRKRKERARRDQRMTVTLKAGTLPYTPEVMSWLSAKLDKRSNRITEEDVKTLLA